MKKIELFKISFCFFIDNNGPLLREILYHEDQYVRDNLYYDNIRRPDTFPQTEDLLTPVAFGENIPLEDF